MKLEIRKETKYLESINKWCCAIWCSDCKATSKKPVSIWTGGFFHKNKEIAEKNAMDSFQESLKFQREFYKPTSKETLIVNL